MSVFLIMSDNFSIFFLKRHKKVDIEQMHFSCHTKEYFCECYVRNFLISSKFKDDIAYDAEDVHTDGNDKTIVE